mgnify:CR=1 FL=1
MDRIRLIASDMDATLLDGHSQLPPDFLHLCLLYTSPSPRD